MLSRQELKQHAKDQLRGKVGILFLVNIIYFAISLGISSIPIISFIGIFVLVPPIELGLIKVYLDITYGNHPEVSTLFSGFQQFGQSVLTYLLITGISFLAVVVIMVPMVVLITLGISAESVALMVAAIVWYIIAFIILYWVTLGLSMIFYIMAEQPDLSATDLVKASWNMMKGHKWEYFVLGLSFFPWMLLAVITLGIALIWILPYIQLTMANYYHNIKGDDYSGNEEYGYYADGYQENTSDEYYTSPQLEDSAFAEDAAESSMETSETAANDIYTEEVYTEESSDPEEGSGDNSSSENDDEWNLDNF